MASNPLTKAHRELIAQRKQAEPFRGYRDTSPTGEPCKIEFLGRGEMAFYQQGDRALLLEVLPGAGVLFAYSIRRWDDGKKVSPEEVEVVIEIVSRVLEKLGAQSVKVVRS